MPYHQFLSWVAFICKLHSLLGLLYALPYYQSWKCTVMDTSIEYMSNYSRIYYSTKPTPAADPSVAEIVKKTLFYLVEPRFVTCVSEDFCSSKTLLSYIILSNSSSSQLTIVCQLTHSIQQTLKLSVEGKPNIFLQYSIQSDACI